MIDQAILNHIWKHPRPRLDELATATGRAVTTVRYHLIALRRKGLLLWDYGVCRTLRLTDSGLLAAQGYRLLYTCDKDGVHLA